MERRQTEQMAILGRPIAIDFFSALPRPGLIFRRMGLSATVVSEIDLHHEGMDFKIALVSCEGRWKSLKWRHPNVAEGFLLQTGVFST